MKYHSYYKHVIALSIALLICFNIATASTIIYKQKADTSRNGTGGHGTTRHHKKKQQYRYYYDFQHKTLLNDSLLSAKILHQPLRFKIGSDISIGVINYNPLKYTLSMGDSTSSFFMSDTSLLPKIGKMSFPTASTVTSAATGKADTSNPLMRPQKVANLTQAPTPKKKTPIVTDCIKMKNLIDDSLSAKKDSILKWVSIYNQFIGKVEVINDCMTNLQNLPALTTTAVKNELNGNFIAQLNGFLTKGRGLNQLNTTANQVSVRDIVNTELQIYQNAMNVQKQLAALQKLADPLVNTGKTACPNTDFMPLLTKFNTTMQSLKGQLNSFDSLRTQKNYPQFKKDMVVYQTIKNYLNVIPEFYSNNTPIRKDEHFIKIFYATADNPTKPMLYDMVDIVGTGFKLDVSIGFFVSGLSDQVFTQRSKDSIFHTQYVAPGGVVHDTIVDQKFTSINKQKQSNLSYGAMVYLNAHSQKYCTFNWGASLGFGTMFNDQSRWVSSLGPTLFIGKTQRFCINPSIIIGQVDRLSAPYQTNTWYTDTIDNIPTFKAWRVSWALGFSWNL